MCTHWSWLTYHWFMKTQCSLGIWKPFSVVSLVVLRREEGSVRLRGWNTGVCLWELLFLSPSHPNSLHWQEMSGGGKGGVVIILPLPWLLFNSVYYTSVCAQLRTWPFSRALGSSQPGWGVKPFILGIARPTYKQRKYSLTLDIVNIPGYNQGQMAVSTTRYQKWSCVSWMNQEGLLGEGKFVSGLTLCRNRILVAREEITRHFKQKVQQK